jgi:hypothetical protein
VRGGCSRKRPIRSARETGTNHDDRSVQRLPVALNRQTAGVRAVPTTTSSSQRKLGSSAFRSSGMTLIVLHSGALSFVGQPCGRACWSPGHSEKKRHWIPAFAGMTVRVLEVPRGGREVRCGGAACMDDGAARTYGKGAAAKINATSGCRLTSPPTPDTASTPVPTAKA